MLRTGYLSSQGSLIRKMRNMNDARRYGSSDQLRDASRIALVLSASALIMAVRVWRVGDTMPQLSTFRLLVQCSRIFLAVVPSDLQSDLMYSVHAGVRRMASSDKVYCVEPNRLTRAGLVNTALFDKTGTITTDALLADGVSTIIQEDEEGDARVTHYESLSHAPLPAQRVAATCHSLSRVAARAPGKKGDENQGGEKTKDSQKGEEASRCTGDPLEVALTCSLGPNWRVACGSNSEAIFIRSMDDLDTGIEAVNSSLITDRFVPVDTFPFDPYLQLMTVVSSCEEANDNYLLVATKGSPESVFMCLKKELRDNPAFKESYFSLYNRLAGNHGKRVVALASRKVPLTDKTILGDRASAESNLIFEGFACLACPLRKDSRRAIQELRNADIRVGMVTGDSLNTACYVAFQSGIFKKET